MKRNIANFQDRTFDLIIIGGGITGACLAHDAASRGLSVALLEKSDFGAATSSASSKLLHGGIRYLPKAQPLKVRESARERTICQVIAPHMSHYVPFLIPTMKDNFMKGKMAIQVGMQLYNFLCIGLEKMVKDPAKKIPLAAFYGRDDLLGHVPLLKNFEGLTGAQVLYESQMFNSERMTLAFIKTAVSNGAQVANYVSVQDFMNRGRRVSGVLCRDVLTGHDFEINGKIVVNAAGPFLPGLNRKIEELKLVRQNTGFSKGVHLVTRQIEDHFALAVSSGKKTEGLVSRGGRHFFVIPWRQRSLIGTTNVPFTGDLNEVKVTAKDINDFIRDINDTFAGLNLEKSDIYFAFTGLYPLVSDEIKPETYQGTGDYQLVDHAVKDNVDGIVSVLGAKYTTARVLAERAIDLLIVKLGLPKKKCVTSTEPLFEGRIPDMENFLAKKKKEYRDIMAPSEVECLVKSHGSEIDAVVRHLQGQRSFLEKICPERETFVGEIDYAVRKEMAYTLTDIIFRRTGLGTIGHPGEKSLCRSAEIMGNVLGWSQKKINDEIALVNKEYSYWEN